MHRIRLIFIALLLGATSTLSAKTIELEVNGLVCAFCAQGIEKSMKQFPATEEVFVSLEQRLVAIALKDGQDISDADITAAIKDAGYTTVNVTRSDATLEAIRTRVAAGHGD